MIFKYLFPDFLFNGLGLGGGGGGQTSKTTQSIPKELKPLAKAYANKAMGVGNQKFSPYGGDRYADLNQTQNQGLQAMIERARGGSQTMDNAEDSLNQMISGGNTNPYLDEMVNRAQESVKSNFNTAAIDSGSFGNSGLQEQFAKELGGVASNMYGNAYEGDRSRQMQAIGMAPQFANQDYQDAQQMFNAGQIQQDQTQQGLDFDFSQYQDKLNLPYKQLAAMSGVFGSGLGGSSTTTSSGGGWK